MKVAVLRDHNPISSEKWEIACRKKNIECIAINMLRNDWLEELHRFNPSFCVSRPPGDIYHNKAIFDEKIFFIEKNTNLRVFPSFLETLIYENKSALNWFLTLNDIPHPDTFISSDENEAYDYITSTVMPIVAKTLIGATGSGVKIIHTKKQAELYIRKAFSVGIRRRFGPNRRSGSLKTWLIKGAQSPPYFVKKLQSYRERNQDIQKKIVLFQRYIPHDYEWRCAKIGDSWFAYKKLKIGEKASGSKQFEYGPPPLHILDFTRELCERFDFNYMAIDLFDFEGKTYVNELQTIFGHKNAYICKVNDKPGRYLYSKNEWIFEEGDFNTNESFDLRLDTAIKLYQEK